MTRKASLTYSEIMSALRILGVPIAKVTKWTEDEDGDIELGGEHDGISIQYGFDGANYYALSRTTEADDYVFRDGTGDLAKDLKEIAS